MGRLSDAQGFGDDGLHDFACATVDPRHTRVRIKTGDGVFGDVPVSAVQLQALVDHPPRTLGAEQLDLGRIGHGEVTRIVELERAVGHQHDGFDVGGALGEYELGVLESRQRFTEDVAVLDVCLLYTSPSPRD